MKKYYAVKKGKKPGVYSTWEECRIQVEGYSGAVYKSFNSKDDAEVFVNNEKTEEENSITNEVIAYVDGSFSSELKRYSYGCVILSEGETVELFGSGSDEKYLSMNNVAGEIFGSVAAIKWAIQRKKTYINIFHDYEGIEKWAEGSWKANKLGTKEYQQFIQKSNEFIKIRFTKVEAHTGVELNERADQLAKMALYQKDNTQMCEGKTRAEEIFEQTMKAPKTERDKKYSIYKEYIISEYRVKQYIKELWSLSGKKKTDVKSIEFYLDYNKNALVATVQEKDGSVQEKVIHLSRVL